MKVFCAALEKGHLQLQPSQLPLCYIRLYQRKTQKSSSLVFGCHAYQRIIVLFLSQMVLKQLKISCVI